MFLPPCFSGGTALKHAGQHLSEVLSIGLSDLANNNTASSVNFEFQINNEKQHR